MSILKYDPHGLGIIEQFGDIALSIFLATGTMPVVDCVDDEWDESLPSDMPRLKRPGIRDY